MDFDYDYSNDFELYKYYRLSLYRLNVQNDDYYYEKDSKTKELIGHSCNFIIESVERWKQQDPLSFKRIEKDYFNLKARKHRCNFRIRYMLDKDLDKCYFFTFTFDDDALKLSEDTRRQYVRRYLSKYCTDYVANIDYGGKTQREHYHAIGIINDLSILMPTKKPGRFNLKYADKGFTCADKVRSCEDYTKLSSYINKITNHCFKDTTTKKLIYSRTFSKDDFYIRMLEYQYLDIDASDINDYASLIDFIDKRTRKMKQIKTAMLKQMNKGC